MIWDVWVGTRFQDGYAVVAADGPGDYEIVGDARCGDAPTYTVKPGTVAYITTGGTRNTK